MIEEFEKQCSRCMELKSHALFYKRSGRAASYGDGLMKECRACHNQIVMMRWRERQSLDTHETCRESDTRNQPARSTGTFAFRVNEFERNEIETLATQWGCSLSDVVRRVVRMRAIELGIIADTSDGSVRFLNQG